MDASEEYVAAVVAMLDALRVCWSCGRRSYEPAFVKNKFSSFVENAGSIWFLRPHKVLVSKMFLPQQVPIAKL